MTKKEEKVIENILYAMEYMRQSSDMWNKLKASAIKDLLYDYYCEIGDLTQKFALDLYSLTPEMSDEGFEKTMKKLMKKGKNEDRDKTDK